MLFCADASRKKEDRPLPGRLVSRPLLPGPENLVTAHFRALADSDSGAASACMQRAEVESNLTSLLLRALVSYLAGISTLISGSTPGRAADDPPGAIPAPSSIDLSRSHAFE